MRCRTAAARTIDVKLHLNPKLHRNLGETTKAGAVKKVENAMFSSVMRFGMIPAYTMKYMEALHRTGQDDDT